MSDIVSPQRKGLPLVDTLSIVSIDHASPRTADNNVDIDLFVFLRRQRYFRPRGHTQADLDVTKTPTLTRTQA